MATSKAGNGVSALERATGSFRGDIKLAESSCYQYWVGDIVLCFSSQARHKIIQMLF